MKIAKKIKETYHISVGYDTDYGSEIDVNTLIKNAEKRRSCILWPVEEDGPHKWNHLIQIGSAAQYAGQITNDSGINICIFRLIVRI